jgi:hypothetical protein
MKKTSFLSLLMAMCLFTPCAYSEQAWVNNVSEDHGWLDYEKNPEKEDRDNNLCWAASASCIIDYWQGLYVTSSSIPSGSAIWERFKEVSADRGGNQIYAIQWWLGGDYEGKTLKDNDTTNDRAAYRSYDTQIPIQTNLDSFSGYYWDSIPDTYPGSINTSPQAAHLDDFFWFGIGFKADFATALIERINSAPIGLAILDTSNKLVHAITLWGVEYENDTISKVWITDSDDYKHTLRSLETGTVTTTDGTFIKLENYSDNSFYGDVYIAQAYGVYPEESDTWGLLRIPEPATTTLTLLSLFVLTNRRRRK